MSKYKTFIATLIILSYNLHSQDTIWVKDGDKSKMELHGDSWLFKDNLADGHYCSYSIEDSKKQIKISVTFKNHKKTGIENRYSIYGDKNKYASINWLDGKKNGIEVHYGQNNAIQELFTFKDNVLNGHYFEGYYNGFKTVEGYFKNGFRDSIWTYYKYKKMDSTTRWKNKEYQYKNGIPFLISILTKNGLQTVKEGNGTEIDSSYRFITTEYRNGKKNGVQQTKVNGNLEDEKIYQNELLIKQIFYSDSNKLHSIVQWSYPNLPKIDTIKSNIGNWVSDFKYNEIKITNTKLANGNWVTYYSNGKINYEGNYIDGIRVGLWNWNYKNGKPRIKANYTENDWQHFDSTGKVISNYKNEYLSALTDFWWFLNNDLDRAEVVLSKENKKTITPKLVFYSDNTLEINSYLECGKDLDQTLNSYYLLANELEINTKTKKYYFEITSANENEIILKRKKK